MQCAELRGVLCGSSCDSPFAVTAHGQQNRRSGARYPAKCREHGEILPALLEAEAQQTEPSVAEELRQRPTESYKNPGKHDDQSKHLALGAAVGFFREAHLRARDGSGDQIRWNLRRGNAAKAGFNCLPGSKLGSASWTSAQMCRDARVFRCIEGASGCQRKKSANFVVFGHFRVRLPVDFSVRFVAHCRARGLVRSVNSFIAGFFFIATPSSENVLRGRGGDSQARGASGSSRSRAERSRLRQFPRASFLLRSAAPALRGTSSAMRPSLRQAVACVRGQSPRRAQAGRKRATKQAWPKNVFLRARRDFRDARAACDQ